MPRPAWWQLSQTCTNSVPPLTAFGVAFFAKKVGIKLEHYAFVAFDSFATTFISREVSVPVTTNK